MMYFKLALRNVLKSYKNYLIYFITLAFSVCLFYMFNSFQEQEALLSLSGVKELDIITAISIIMKYLSVFVSFVLAFLILYANNYLIKQRKKEFGLYTLLGMPKTKMSRVLIYETMMIGFASLVIGLLLGIVLSQILVVFTAQLFRATLNYSFIFSMDSLKFTIFSFGIIFLFVMLFNTFVLNKYKLIDLINADRKQEKVRISNIYLSVIIFLISIVCIGCSYYMAIKYGMLAINYLPGIIVLGSIGTVLFFMSLSGFLLKFIQTSKSLYYRKLNMFVLRQVNANINSNFLSMSVVCIMLLLSIGALATGMNLKASINHTIEMSTPYEYSYARYEGEQYNRIELEEQERFISLEEDIELLQVEKENYIKEEFFLDVYYADCNMEAFIPYIKDKNMKKLFNKESGMELEVMKESDYNRLMKEFDGKELSLKKGEGYLFTNLALLDDIVKEIIKGKPDVYVFGNDIKITNDSFEGYYLGTRIMQASDLLLVVKDEVIPEDAHIYQSYWNVTLKEEVEANVFEQHVLDKFEQYLLKEEKDIPNIVQLDFWGATNMDVADNSTGISVVFTYIGIYLGIVFLVASAVILALQQLSQANDNKKRYVILNKIGTDKKMMNQSILFQLSIYFMVPLILAISHSIIGIQVVNNLVMVFGQGNILYASLLTGGIIIIIYGAYFYVTYIGYKNILNGN